ncbi:MAG: GTP-binding protein [Candidatus Methylacidiphilales bacterium]
MIPLILLSGFLGSGKTSFLRRLAPALAARGIIPSIVLNDFQNARVDAATLDGLAEVIAPIQGSCVCCGSREEFLDLLAEVAVPERGALLVETNGTTDTPELLEMLAVDRRAARFAPPVQIGLIDLKRWQKRGWNNALESDQIRTASYLAFSRADQVSEERAAAVRAAVSTINPTALTVDPESFAELVEIRIQSGCGFATPRVSPSRSQPHASHHRFSALQLALKHGLDEGAILAWLAALPDNVLRVKGAGNFGPAPGQWRVFQWTEGTTAGEFLNLRRAPEVGSVAVVIGAGLEADAVLARAVQAGITA